jgi:hypothetical protein
VRLRRPRFTVRKMMLAVAVLALAMGLFSFLTCGPTFYAAGFTEAKFASLRKGMTPGEVTTIIGPPLENVQSEDGTALWTYSNRDSSTCDFEMRWVHFRDGKVVAVVNMHWDD